MSIQAAVHIGNSLFILKIIYITDTTKYIVCIDLLTTIYCQSFINHYIYLFLTLKYVFKPLATLICRKHRLFVSIYANAYIDFVEKWNSPVYNINMSKG